ncbi:MAG: dihydrodipicolinate synthase family protein [Candidatus Thorarchaeota archaeon]|jgi:4-hydroxy-tetrahydrodipicolinate synthase
MNFEDLKNALRGTAITTVTPFNQHGSEVDVSGIERNLTYLVENDAKLIIPCGNTGEFYSLDDKEWQQVVSTSKETVGDKLTVVAGIGHSIKTALNQIETCKKHGVDGVMVMYPQHVFSSEEGVLDYYSVILNAAEGLGVVLYKKGPLLTDEILGKLMKYSNLVAVKYAFGRIVDFSRTVHKLGTKILWSCGTAERFAPFYWLAGAEAITTGLGNFAPKLSQQMYDALFNHDYEEAMKIQKIITPLEDLREGRGKANNVPIVKAVMDHLGLLGGNCRPPIHSLTDDERKAAIDAIAGWNVKSSHSS